MVPVPFRRGLIVVEVPKHTSAMQSAIRPAAVAGTFYPSDPNELRGAVGRHLASAGVSGVGGADRPPKVLVVPHAGYVYSGDVAALAYAPLVPWRGRITRIVLLGPVHRVAVQGLAAPTVAAFETPLGRVPLDRDALAGLRDLHQVVWTDVPHAQEHSLEVQLPFLQSVLRRLHAGAAGGGPGQPGRGVPRCSSGFGAATKR